MKGCVEVGPGHGSRRWWEDVEVFVPRHVTYVIVGGGEVALDRSAGDAACYREDGCHGECPDAFERCEIL